MVFIHLARIEWRYNRSLPESFWLTPILTWETSEQTNIGIDARFLDNRLSFTMDWYSKQTKDLLVEVSTNAASGFATQYQNAGTVKNDLELSMGWERSDW